MSRYAKMRKSNAQDILYLKPEYGDIITEISEYLQEEGMCAYELEKNREELVKKMCIRDSGKGCLQCRIRS